MVEKQQMARPRGIKIARRRKIVKYSKGEFLKL